MGLFDLSGGDGTGYAQVKNVQNFTNEDLLEKLSQIEVSFGKPEMGAIGKTPSVMYKKVTRDYDVFVRVHKNNVIMGKIGTDGVNSVETAVVGVVGMSLGHKLSDFADADHAVDELAAVIKKLEAGEEVTQSHIASATNTSTGSAIEFFMEQKFISVKPKFKIFDAKEEPVFYVEGDITRLNYSINRNGEEVAKIKKKLIALLPEYTIYLHGQQVGKLKKKLKLLKPELVGTINGQELHVMGDLMGADYDLSIGGTTIGHIDTTRQFVGDCYRIRVFDESQIDLMAALAIICDNVVDQEND